MASENKAKPDQAPASEPQKPPFLEGWVAYPDEDLEQFMGKYAQHAAVANQLLQGLGLQGVALYAIQGGEPLIVEGRDGKTREFRILACGLWGISIEQYRQVWDTPPGQTVLADAQTLSPNLQPLGARGKKWDLPPNASLVWSQSFTEKALTFPQPSHS